MDVGETKPRRRITVDIPLLPTLRVVYSGEDGILRDEPLSFEPGVTRLGRAPSGSRTITIDDRHVSRTHAEVRVLKDPGGERVELVDLASSNGTYLNGRSVQCADLEDGDVVRMGDTLLVFRRDQDLSDAPVEAIKGLSPAIRTLRCSVELFASSMATIILLGDTGTGKEVVARALHRLSDRKGPFVAVNCSAIPETLAESMLFGHVAGSFTGATEDRRGYFETANRGTLFLDELGDLPQSIQPKLLRALEERRVMPVGSAREVPFDVRIVCATESKLHSEIVQESFRGALYARLAEVTLELPPLRERREDILLLTKHFLDMPRPRITPRLAEALLLYDWPFNVRELSKVAQELQLRARGDSLLTLESIVHRLPGVVLDDQVVGPSSSEPSDARITLTYDLRPDRDPVERQEPAPSRDELVELLRQHGGNISRVARHTGRSRRQVYRWMEDFGIDLDDFR